MEVAQQQAKDQAELNELLIWAAARGLLADAEELVARGAELTTRDKHGSRPVHFAAAHGHLGMLQYLSRKGADLEAEDPQARLPLHHAAASAKGVEALRYLTQHTTWLSAPDANDDTPLHLAARKGWLDGVKLLLAAGAEVDLANKSGLSALGEAVARGHVEVAEALLEAGADPDWRAAGYTLLHVAAGLGQVEAIKLLLKHCSSAATLVNDSDNDDGATPLHAAAMGGHTATAQLLMSHGANAGIVGVDGTAAWELVPEAEPISSAAKQQPAPKQQQQQLLARQQNLKELRKLLKDAAGKAGKSQAIRSGNNSGKKAAHSSKAVPAAAALGPVEAFSVKFGQLSPAEQNRRVDGFARMSAAELQDAGYLSREARAAVAQVHRAQQLLSVYRAVASLRADQEFQEDASDPEVQAALQDMGRNNNMEKYAGRRQVVSVATKLKKFHTVLQECGGVKLGLQDLLTPPGQSMADLAAKDAAQVEQLMAAAAAARAEAVAAITGQPVADAPGSRRSVGKPQGLSVADGGEIEPMDDAKQSTSLEATPDNDLDRELLQHRQEQAGALSGSSSSLLARVRRYLRPPREELEAMPFGERMRYEMINSFLQAVKIMLMLTAFMGVMWCLGLLPSQQDPQLLEARIQQHMMQGQGDVEQQQEVVQRAFGEVGHEEL